MQESLPLPPLPLAAAPDVRRNAASVSSKFQSCWRSSPVRLAEAEAARPCAGQRQQGLGLQGANGPFPRAGRPAMKRIAEQGHGSAREQMTARVCVARHGRTKHVQRFDGPTGFPLFSPPLSGGHRSACEACTARLLANRQPCPICRSRVGGRPQGCTTAVHHACVWMRGGWHAALQCIIACVWMQSS